MARRSTALLPLLPLLLLPSGGAGAEETRPPPVQDAVQGHPADPWEGFNRGIFAFNEALDRWVLEPVAKGWDWALPDPVQRSVGNFFDNLAMPVRVANDLLQAKPMLALESTWRLAINSVGGVGGLFDVASHYQVYDSDEDFGQTMGYWGMPTGPYLVLPLFGPSNPRDAVGRAVDTASTPQFYFVPFYVSIPAATVDVVNDRADVIETLAAERAAAFDFYSAARSAYIQYRENQVRDRDPDDTSQDDEDLYYFDEDEE
jgi:phospholipid-binding lipoprotein MlaA